VTAPTDTTGTLYQTDPFHATQPKVLPPQPAPAVAVPASPLDELTARIATLEAERDEAMRAALDRDPQVREAVKAVLDATEARDRLAVALSDAAKVLTGEVERPPRRRGRRGSKHAAGNGG
jgi:hypothetical protein